MEPTTRIRSMCITVVATIAIGLSSTAAGGGGGRGGDSGDSSMNPFTGDSYAYFHGGHNLGEEGTIRPNRVSPKPNLTKAPKASDAASAPADQPLRDANRTDAPDRSANR